MSSDDKSHEGRDNSKDSDIWSEHDQGHYVRQSKTYSSDNDHKQPSVDSFTGDLAKAIIMEGWLDKCGQNIMLSKWTHRWCVLSGSQFIYYVDESKSVQKMAYDIDDTCKVTSGVSDKKKFGGREYVITLHKPKTLSVMGYELLLSCDDQDQLKVWESALSGVIATLRQKKEAEAIRRKTHTPRLSVIMDSILDVASGSLSNSPSTVEGNVPKSKAEKRPSIFRRLSSIKTNTPELPVDTSELRKSAVKGGKVSKRNQGDSEYSEEYCVLASSSLTFFEDSTMEEIKSVVSLDSSCYLTRFVTDKKAKACPSRHLLSLHTRGTGKNFVNKTSELMLSFPTETQLSEWENNISKVLYDHMSKVHDIVVRVKLFIDETGTIGKIEEPIFKITLLIDNEHVVEQYHHYIDIREVYSKLKSLSAGIITAVFPKAHKRSNFNQSLTEEEIENRMIGLQIWLQDLVTQYSQFDYLNFIGGINDVQVDIAGLFGTQPNALKAFMKTAREKKVKASTHVAPPPLPKSKVMSLFEKYEDEDGDAVNVPPPSVAQTSSVNLPLPVASDDDDLRMPSSPDKLVLYNIMQLAKLCKIHQMDCTDFKCKKNYINALSTTYQKALPYLHNKEARPIIGNLIQMLEYNPASINDQAVNIEIDKIFIDLLRKLNVAEGLLGLLSMEFNSFEKLSRIQSCISVWDKDLFFTQEDRLLLQQFTTDRFLDSFSVLNLSSRLTSCVAEGSSTWLNRWCVLRGIPALISRIDTIVEQEPLQEVDAVILLHLLHIFRQIMDTDCRYELVCTRGAIEALVMSIRFNFKALAIESLNLLSEVIVYGGPDAVWQVINGFKFLAYSRKESFLQVLVDGLLDQDVTVQCSILHLINNLLLAEGDINNRIKMRCSLFTLKFEDICKIFKNEYARMARVPKPNDATSGTVTGSFEDQIRDKIDRLLFGGKRKLESMASMEDGDEGEYLQENERTLQLRPGVQIWEKDFGSGLAEDFDTHIHPEKGIMEGHIVAISKKSDADDESGFRSWEGVVKNVARRLSLTETKAPPPPDDQNKYERNWYELHDNILSWFNLADKTDSYRERLGSLDISRVIDIMDFSSLTCKVKVPLQNMFSLVLCDEEEHLNFYLDSLETKHKWILAIRVVQKRMSLRKCAYRLPVNKIFESSTTLKLQKEFEHLFSLYESFSKSDVCDIYSTTIADAVTPGGGVLPHDPVALVRFIDLELKKHRNSAKLKSLMSDIAEYVNENYAPKEEVPDEDEEDEVKIIHPLAVPHSERPIAQAPPLPFIPPEKKPRIPNKKVKQLFWTKVKPVNVWKSVWEGMDEPELTWNLLDEQFGEIIRRRKAIVSNSNTSVETKPKAIALFDGKRTQNAAIACGKLRKTPEEIFDMIVSLDPEELTQEINETILNLLLPTDEEIAALRAYTGNVEDLDFCGRLFSYLTEIERLESRLRVQHVMLSWNGEASVIFDQLNTIKLALQEMNDPESLESFEIILAAVLAAGNYMNGKSSRGQAHGYKLDILPKLRNIKQVSFGKKTFLHFIIGQCQLHFPGHIAFYEKWNFMWKSPKVVLKNLENIMTELKTNLDICVAEIEVAEAIESEQCRVPLMENLGAFITQATETMQVLRDLFESIDKDVRFVKKYFGETSVAAVLTSHDDDPWCSFFSLFVNFANMHRLCSVELEEWEKAEERIKKNALARKAKLSSGTSKPSSSKSKLPFTGNNNDRGNTSLQMVARERTSSLESNSSVERKSGQPVAEGNMIDMFKKKMLVIRQKANAANDHGVNDSDSDDDDAW